MFRSKKIPKHQRMVEQDLEHALAVLPLHQPDSEEFDKILKSAERLHALLNIKSPGASVSQDTLVTVAANLLGILLIIKHEDVNVITSKALGFVIRVR